MEGKWWGWDRKIYLYESLFFPPIISSISSVSLRSGSKPRLPPGDDSNRKPKSIKTEPITYIHIRHL